MTEVPDFIARAIAAQGKTTVEEVAAALPSVTLDTVEPTPTPEEEPVEQEMLDLGPDLCPECNGERFTETRTGEKKRCGLCNALPPDEPPLSDPDRDAIGKFQRPGDAADTQRLAAIQAYPTTGTKRRYVLDMIGFRGEHGATDEEMQDELGMNPSTQRPRRVELVEGGWIEDSTRTRRTHAKVEAVVWVLTARGRQEWGR